MIASILVAAAAAVAAPNPSPSQAVEAVIRFTPPKGWRKEEYANGGGADPVVAWIEGHDRLAARVFGAPGSAYATPAAFLKSPAAASLRRAPVQAGPAKVAGLPVTVWRRSYLSGGSDPHAGGGPPRHGSELFVILPAGKRFVVLSWSNEAAEKRGEKAWKAFLASVRKT